MLNLGRAVVQGPLAHREGEVVCTALPSIVPGELILFGRCYPVPAGTEIPMANQSHISCFHLQV